MISLALPERSITGNHLKADNIQNFYLAVLFWNPPLVEYLEALHHVVVGVFGQILDPEFENDTSTFEETFMGAM